MEGEKMVDDGIHFGLPEQNYHEIQALSASGIKHLLAHPLVFWANSWMNPDKQDNSSDARDIGRAYHKRILEGREAFYKSYASSFAPPDDCVTTQDQLMALCSEHGLAVSGTKPVLADRLRSAGVDFKYHDDMLAAYRELHDGKEFVKQELIDRIELSAAMIEKNPELNRCFTGGMPEVSVVWHETIDGELVRFKCRFDYLKSRAICDLKTFENEGGRSVDKAIYRAMAAYKYHIQAVFYAQHAAPKAVEFAKTGRVFGYAEPDYLSKLAKAEQHDFYFVFQMKGIAPIARGKIFPRGSMWNAGNAAVMDGINQFITCRKIYGESPWVDQSRIEQLEDEAFPVYATEL